MENELVQDTNEVLETTNTNVAEVENVVEDVTTEPTQEVATKSLKELLRENPEYQEQFNTMTKNRLERQKREYENKYSRLETVLNAGLGTSNMEEATNKLEGFYREKGIDIPEQPQFSVEDIEALGEKDAKQFISNYDYEEVVEEVDRLANIGTNNMSPRELALFKNLAEYRQSEGRKRELTSIGVKEDLINSEEFKTFASQFNESTPIKNVYDLYTKTQPKPKVEPIGSMKTTPIKDTGVKEFYTREEALKFTKKDFDNNPELFKAVENSMYKW